MAGDTLPTDQDRLAAIGINEQRLNNYYYLIAHSEKEIDEPDFISFKDGEG